MSSIKANHFLIKVSQYTPESKLVFGKSEKKKTVRYSSAYSTFYVLINHDAI